MKLSGATRLIMLMMLMSACTPAGAPAERWPADKVRIGMSTREVGQHLGRADKMCWLYERGAGVTERVCFTDGLVSAVGRETLLPGSHSASIDTVFSTNDRPAREEILTSTAEVTIGMAPAEVVRLKGEATTVEMHYYSSDGPPGIHYATFRKGTLVKLSFFALPLH